MDASPGRLWVTVRPRRTVGMFILTFDLLFLGTLYQMWIHAIGSVRIFLGLFVLAVLVGTAYELSGEEVIQFDSQSVTIRKSIGRWGRTRRLRADMCSGLEWHRGHRGSSYLACEVGRWTERFANRISENDADRIMASLLENVPDVGHKLLASQAGQRHFVGLGLNNN